MKGGELLALGAAMLAFAGGLGALRWGIDKGDPRRAMARRVRAEADVHDLVIVTDEAPQLLSALAPVPAVWGTPALPDLTGFRRLYVMAQGDGQLRQYEARYGAPTNELAPHVVRWDLDGLRTVRFDLVTDVLQRATVHREGSRFEGPCPRVGNRFQCHSGDDWNHPRVEEHPLGGSSIRCLFAHPQNESRLVIEIPDIAHARFLVGLAGLDDRAVFPGGATVTNHVTFTPSDGAPPVEADMLAPNGTRPYRIALGGHPGRLRFAISTPNAGARQFCFTALVTD